MLAGGSFSARSLSKELAYAIACSDVLMPSFGEEVMMSFDLFLSIHMCSYLKFLLSSVVAGGANVLGDFSLRGAMLTYLERVQ